MKVLKPTLLAILLIGLTLNTLATESSADKAYDSTCEYWTEAEANLLLLFGDTCHEGITYIVEKRHFLSDIEFDKNKEYEIKNLCLLHGSITGLNLVNYRGNYPTCLDHIRSISLTDSGKVSVKVFETLPNLMQISITNSELTGTFDLENIKQLFLTKVDLSHEFSISENVKLDILSLRSVSGTSDLTIFKDQTKIKKFKLSCSDTGTISDLSALGEFHKLENLSISCYEHLLNFPELNNHPNLSKVAMSGQFDYFNQLKNLTGLKELKLSTAKLITDLTPLKNANLHSIEYMDLSGQDIADVTPLSGLKTLNRVEIGYKIPRLNDLTNYYSQENSNADFDLFRRDLLSCSPETKEEYLAGRRCSEVQQKHCGKYTNSDRWRRNFCVWWYSDWF